MEQAQTNKPGGDPEHDTALSAALKYLRGRDRFEAEVRAKCLAAGCTPGAVEKAIHFLKDKNLIDDFSRASAIADKLANEKLQGPLKIRKTLKDRFAAHEAIEAALESIPAEKELLERLAEKLKRRGITDRNAAARRMLAAGFSGDSVRQMFGEE